LRQLGKSYENLVHDLTEAYGDRTIQCLLLEDMSEITRFPGNFELSGSSLASGVAEIRLYESNLAVLPANAKSFQWRLADIDDLRFDLQAYEVALQCGANRLKFIRLAKRTEEFASKVREAMNALATQTTQALHGMLPFLNPDQLQSCSALLPEGRSASLAKLSTVHKQIPSALAANAVDKDLKPYYDQLIGHAAKGFEYAGFKLIRPEDTDAASPASTDAAEPDRDATDSLDADAAAPEILYWFLFPLVRSGTSKLANVVAWEASSRSGRATYFFRLVDPSRASELNSADATAIVDSAVRRLNTVLAMLNFRRRPIYLSDDELAMDPRFHRYAIAARRLPEVREGRASFLGRALHSPPEAWQSQVDNILKKAAS
jgi:hypothetical protein